MQKPLMALSQKPRHHDQTPALHDLAVLVDGEGTGPKRLAGAPCEDAEVIGVFKVLSEHDVADVQQRGKLSH